MTAVAAAALAVQVARPDSLLAPPVIGTWKMLTLVPVRVTVVAFFVLCPFADAPIEALQTASEVPAKLHDSEMVTSVPIAETAE